MRIKLKTDVFLKLELATLLSKGLEFSGLGFVNVLKENEETVFEVYDIEVMDVGSSALTEIPSEKILPLLDRSDARNMKLWFHRHPVGNHTIGAHNWSATDENTATKTPLGGVPEMVKWALAIVRTPQAWVGRLDMFGKDEEVKTAHLEVEYYKDEPFAEAIIAMREDHLERMRKEMEQLRLTYRYGKSWRTAGTATPFTTPLTRLRDLLGRTFAVRKGKR